MMARIRVPFPSAQEGAATPPLTSSATPAVWLMDSITQVVAADAGAVVVSGSHGGRSSGHYALAVPLKLAVFNDAGGGKEGAGIAALAMLQARGAAAVAVGHDSARIGEAEDAWAHGVISHLNEAAAALGLARGERLQDAVRRLVAGPQGHPNG
jgi:hypothetical protein